MKRYEYNYVNFLKHDVGGTIELLNRYGNDGWMIVGVCGNLILLMREIKERK